MARVIFTGSPRLTLNSINRIKRKLVLGGALSVAVAEAVDGVKMDAVSYLQESVRDPAATMPGEGEHVREVEANIDSGIQKSISGVMGWCGDVRKMDEYLTTNGVPLWRILETGAAEHSIYPVNTDKLRFYFYREGSWVNLDMVKHPGQKGRLYFYKATQHAPAWFDKYVKPAFFAIFSAEGK
uniref:Uncharacterized protein n=1 Tax=viral metagenome TaxID=1070528 RepID=A0A6M3IIM2_9ZZZZ